MNPILAGACIAALGALLFAAPAAAQSGSIVGQLFTAEHPDSVARGAEILLIFRNERGEVERVPATAGPHGEYEFLGLSTDPALQYVIRVTYFGRDFLGAPIQFSAGQTELAYNFLVARDAAPLPSGGMEGHPPVSGHTHAETPEGVREDPVVMIVIVLTILSLFALPIVSAYRRDQELRAQLEAESPEVAALVRDIASLDLRYERSEIEKADYEAVRRSLLRKLEELTQAVREERA